ncbi:MAG: hypothetical protein Q4D51_13010 [Eubacteriales bacterium]|nr:hypothetical protein [Eubacteriales bacterium]
MFGREDHSYQEILEKSVEQWLADIEKHEDIVVYGGVKATREYIESLKKQITVLEEKSQLKDSYLKKLKSKC